MSKLVLIPNSIEETKNSENLVDAYILGIENLSVNLPCYFTLKEIKEISKITSKDIFISLNKNMHNSDLDVLKQTLLELEKMDIKGILFYDIALVNLKHNLNLHNELVWNQEHLVTNACTCNFWLNEGVNYAYLSSDITLAEIKDISKETDMQLMVNIFGYIPMFTSKRHLIKNYLENFELDDDSKINYIQKEGKIYPIIDNLNTTVYSNNILNGIDEYLEIKDDIKYVIINGFNIESDKTIEILRLFKNVDSSNVKEYSNKIDSMFPNVDKCFLHKETVYKVKKND